LRVYGKRDLNPYRFTLLPPQGNVSTNSTISAL
jgi:hypothetical protein